MNKIIKALRLVGQGKTISDKLTILYFFVRYPVSLSKKLPYDVTIQNEHGTYLCGNIMNSVWDASSFHEIEAQPYLSMNEGVFIDVGANIGKYSIKLGRMLGDKGQVIAIEPEKRNYGLLLQNIGLNSLDNVTALKIGCYSFDGYMDLNIAQNPAGHSLKSEVKNQAGNLRTFNDSEIIRVASLDNIVERLKIKRVDMIKVDVERCELEVLRGAEKTILLFRPKIVFEAITKQSLREISKYLKIFGYKIKKIQKIMYLAEYDKKN